MVCVPCIFIPVLLFLWRLIVQPLFLRFIWNPWSKKENEPEEKKELEFPFTCSSGVCSFNPKQTTMKASTKEQGKTD